MADTKTTEVATAYSTKTEWVLALRLGDVDGIQADDWMTWLEQMVMERDPGFSGLLTLHKEKIND